MNVCNLSLHTQMEYDTKIQNLVIHLRMGTKIKSKRCFTSVLSANYAFTNLSDILLSM